MNPLGIATGGGKFSGSSSSGTGPLDQSLGFNQSSRTGINAAFNAGGGFASMIPIIVLGAVVLGAFFIFKRK